MSEMKVKGIFNKSEIFGVTSKYKVLFDEVVSTLKVDQSKVVEIDTGAQSNEEIVKKVQLLRAQRRSVGSDSDYANLKFVTQENENMQLRAFALWDDKAKKNKSQRKNRKQAKTNNGAQAAQNTDVQSEQPKPESITQTKEQMLKSVERIPVQMLPIALAQYQGMVMTNQQQLGAQGVTDEARAKLNEEAQALQEVIDAIRKKMGQ